MDTKVRQTIIKNKYYPKKYLNSQRIQFGEKYLQATLMVTDHKHADHFTPKITLNVKIGYGSIHILTDNCTDIINILDQIRSFVFDNQKEVDRICNEEIRLWHKNGTPQNSKLETSKYKNVVYDEKTGEIINETSP